MLKITVEKTMEPVFASVPLKLTYILAFAVAVLPSLLNSSESFFPDGGPLGVS